MKHVKLLIFVGIILVGFLLRFYDLGKTPNSLNWDEVSWGYNAYSILVTGMDEHGKVMPLSFQAFGDFKQPVYVYLTSISIALFGLSAFSVRFASAFLGVLAIPFVYLLVFELFKTHKNRYSISVVSMALFAISPWSIQFSKVAYEANIGLFFVICGAALFLMGLNRRSNIFLFSSMIPLAVSGYSYHSEKLFTPIFVVGLLIFAYLRYKLSKKIIALLLFTFLLLSVFWIADSRTTARGRSVTFVSNQTEILEKSAANLIYSAANNDPLGVILNNRRIIYANYYLENYLSHFNPNYLFVLGDDARHHAYGMGVLYLVLCPFIIWGIIKIDKKKYWLVFFWLLLAPVASSLAIDAPNASRSLIFLPTWHIFEAYGLVALFVINRKSINVLKIIIVIAIVVNFFYFVHNYFSHTNSEYGKYWQYGYREAMIAAQQYSTTNRVFISSDYEQGYIFYLFHNDINPKEYLASGGSLRIKDACYQIGQVYFQKCNEFVRQGDIFVSLYTVDDKNFSLERKLHDEKGNAIGYIYKYR